MIITMIELFSYQLSYQHLVLIGIVGLFIGMAKTGVHGMGMVAIPILAVVFGGKNSSGIMLPILIFADFFGVSYYHRHTEWSHLKKLLPFAILGIVLGTLIGNWINDVLFRQLMAVIIFGSLGIMIWLEKSTRKLPNAIWFSILIGLASGFTTMVGNLAGSVVALYLLSMRLPKNEFIGTAAWFFMIMNLLKVPFHVFIWQTISFQSFMLDLILIPAIATGAFVGIWIVKKIPEKSYRLFIIAMTAIAAIFMVI
jgi:hypothetical protein